MNQASINWLWTAMITDDKTVLHILNCTHTNKGPYEKYIISEAIAIIQCKGYGEISVITKKGLVGLARGGSCAANKFCFDRPTPSRRCVFCLLIQSKKVVIKTMKVESSESRKSM